MQPSTSTEKHICGVPNPALLDHHSKVLLVVYRPGTPPVVDILVFNTDFKK
jgi:hypothetical protein